MGLFYPISEDFMVISIQNMCGNAILMCQIPILVKVIYDCNIGSKTTFKGLAPIKEVKDS